jgi:hypothetical protein
MSSNGLLDSAFPAVSRKPHGVEIPITAAEAGLPRAVSQWCILRSNHDLPACHFQASNFTDLRPYEPTPYAQHTVNCLQSHPRRLLKTA